MKKRRVREINKIYELDIPIYSTFMMDDERNWIFLISVDNVPSHKRVIWWTDISTKNRITDTDIKNWQSAVDFASTEWEGRL